jgi:hypothetical protein
MKLFDTIVQLWTRLRVYIYFPNNPHIVLFHLGPVLSKDPTCIANHERFSDVVPFERYWLSGSGALTRMTSFESNNMSYSRAEVLEIRIDMDEGYAWTALHNYLNFLEGKDIPESQGGNIRFTGNEANGKLWQWEITRHGMKLAQISKGVAV